MLSFLKSVGLREVSLIQSAYSFLSVCRVSSFIRSALLAPRQSLKGCDRSTLVHEGDKAEAITNHVVRLNRSQPIAVNSKKQLCDSAPLP